MAARTSRSNPPLLPHGWPDVLRQVLLFACAYYGYRIVRGLADGRATAAYQNARDLISLERTLGIFVEPAVQSWAVGKSWLIDAACWLYLNSHFTITIAVLAYVYLARNSSFYFIRNMFMVAMGLALVGYGLYPTAPPRFMPELGFSDSVAHFTGVTSDSASVNLLFNPFAAVPSMHVAFALMLGIPLAQMTKAWWTKCLWWFYPALVTFSVIATGNHYALDVVLGALTACVAASGASLIARAGPQIWGWSPQPVLGTNNARA